MPISEATYERMSLENPDEKWELVCGELREKPPMTYAHQDIAWTLADELRTQLPRGAFAVGQESPKLRTPAGNYRIPDVCVVPRELIRRLRAAHPDALGAMRDPMPLVVEVWSPSTGATDLRAKLGEYQQRGDLEIWYIHPYERTLTAWRRRPDGGYVRTLYSDGVVEPATLPGVVIELKSLFL